MRDVCASLVVLALVTGCIQSERRLGQGPTDTSSDSGGTGGEVDSTTSGGDTTSGCGGCEIGEACVEAATINPDEPCQVCDPERDKTAWSARPNETECDAGDPCSAPGTCLEGHCATLLLPGCGELPACATDIACDAGGCFYVLVGGTCYIDGDCRDEGALEPGNVCRWCEPDRDQFDWSDNDGRDCDDGDACTYEDRCEAGQCGGTDNDCDDPFACTLDFCDSGHCVNQLDSGACLIAEHCFDDGDEAPDAQCRVCSPELSQRQWSLARGVGCDDGDVCTREDTCDQAGVCKGAPIGRGQEPNEGPGQAALIGEGVVTYPAGNLELNLNPLTDKDYFWWSMPLVANDGLRRPTTRVKNDAARAIRSCVYAACGQIVSTLVKPTVACGELAVEASGPIAGCCDEIPAGQQRTVAIEATCPDGGTIQQGLAYASVRFVSNVAGDQGPACGDYTLEFGAALKQ